MISSSARKNFARQDLWPLWQVKTSISMWLKTWWTSCTPKIRFHMINQAPLCTLVCLLLIVRYFRSVFWSHKYQFWFEGAFWHTIGRGLKPDRVSYYAHLSTYFTLEYKTQMGEMCLWGRISRIIDWNPFVYLWNYDKVHLILSFSTYQNKCPKI